MENNKYRIEKSLQKTTLIPHNKQKTWPLILLVWHGHFRKSGGVKLCLDIYTGWFADNVDDIFIDTVQYLGQELGVSYDAYDITTICLFLLLYENRMGMDLSTWCLFIIANNMLSFQQIKDIQIHCQCLLSDTHQVTHIVKTCWTQTQKT
jgi:hypothetical protein